MYRHLTDCNVLIDSFCRIPKSARQSILEDQCSSNFLCAVPTHREKNASRWALHITYIHVEHYISRRTLYFTSNITYHVEPLHITYIHVDDVVHTKCLENSSFRSIRRSFLRAIIAICYCRTFQKNIKFIMKNLELINKIKLRIS